MKLCQRQFVLMLFVTAFAGSALGCGSEETFHGVTGRVTLDGEPLAGASVVFLPETADSKVLVGLTDDTGLYTLSWTGEARRRAGWQLPHLCQHVSGQQ